MNNDEIQFHADFIPYVDKNGLLLPAPLTSEHPDTVSDNGVMFLSEYIVIATKLEYDIGDSLDYIRRCIDQYGMLNRVPVGQGSGQEGPDDYLAVLNACYHTSETTIPKGFLKGLIRFYGFLNNHSPGEHTKEAFLIRQPQLVAAMASAAFPSHINPIHYLIRGLLFPFYLIAAISIAISCIGVDSQDTDSRRLSWHLLQTTKQHSLLCYLASLIWYRRLYKTYHNGMKDVAAIYYDPKPNNPYSKYWIS